MTNIVRTVEFLPEIFRTDTNKQFLAASLDIVTQQSNLKRVEGFIGNKYGNGVDPWDRYVVEPTATRRDYQLDPSVIFLKPDTQQTQDFISYPGIVQALKNNGAIVDNHDRLFENNFYSWDPFVDYDKIVNYAQYYWIPLGPDAVPVTIIGSITDTILNQVTYTSDNGVKFTNGLKVEFASTVTPSMYASNQYYVEGVGSSIVLLAVSDFVVPESSGSAIYGLWDVEPWDSISWDAQLYASINTDYLTISRASDDDNAWTRSNRWFHQDVLNITQQQLGAVTSENSNPVTRALRPILEFRGNLQLWNSGNNSVGSITVLDTVTQDAFSTIVGQTSYIVDGQGLQDGNLIVFSADTDVNVRNTIYQVSIVPAGPDGIDVIALIDSGITVIDQSQFCVLTGTQYFGTSWRWNETTKRWISCQQKSQVNQAPLFDIYDADGISVGNSLFYTGTTFSGTKLFSYSPGTGKADPVLGFPIQYSSVTNIGDISFTVNMNQDTFTYTNSINQPITKQINIGYVHAVTSPTEYNILTGWINAIAPSIQYQTYEFNLDTDTNNVVCDVPASQVTNWAPTQIYVNDSILTSDQYQVIVDLSTLSTIITFPDNIPAGSRITALIYSEYVSSTAFYQIPSNLQSNPFNTNITTVDVGDIRNQYRSIYANAPGIEGPLFGDNNVHDLGNLNSYGTSIIQNSASLVLPGLFLRKPEVDFFEALKYNRDQYQIYKSLIVDLAASNDYSIEQSPAEILDSIIYEIGTTRSNNTVFFWTDTLFSASPYITNSYRFGAAPASAIFTLNRVYSTDRANYYAVAIYLTREIDGINKTQQLIRGIDYVISPIAASVTVTAPIIAGDVITVKEFNQTYGSYCPSTPSSLGLYPAWVPRVVYDTSYNPATYFIQGHDGSYVKLYGNYVNGQLDDFRDIALLEFETRIYNNIKTGDNIPLDYSTVYPGQFRTTEYSNSEIVNIYSTEFLNWVGTNRIDYKTQFYNLANPFSYNYNQSQDKLSDDSLKQGYWRGIYRWLYDTDSPDTRPWEMLGLSVKPDWWDARYGAAPYTSGNTYMWDDIAAGYVWNDGSSYIADGYVRPALLSILPVNNVGELLNPFVTIVGDYNKLTFNKDWRVGDQGPAESSYIKSSNWPFDMIRILALTKPARFFNLFADLDLYRYNTELEQYLYNDRYHLDSRTLQIYGDGTAKNSYINWVVDYVNVKNLNGYATVSTLLQNMDVRLTYNMAGFSAKDYLRFYIERATPNSKNTSFLIPDESYSVLLYDNIPEEQIYYSSVIIQRVANGWKVWGNSQNRQYFTIVTPKQNGLYREIRANNTSVKVWNDWYAERKTIVPYGTLLYGRDSVADFLNNYGHYLVEQGVVFDNINNNTVFDWDHMIQEFLAWSEQDWEVGSLIALNPNAQYFVVNRTGLVVQPLTMQDQNFILNQNLIPIQNQNSAVIRENEKFSVKILTDGDTVSYTNLNLNSIEHAVVFDNSSVFNDVIYNLTTGLRQTRLLLKGYKTAEWTGFVDTPGFILNEDNIKEWINNRKYAKGTIVLYKSLYWVASSLIEPSIEFDTNLWFRVNYDQIKLGLLPNPSTTAYESLYYYDSNRANLELDADQLAFSLIGYRPRDYMAAADLTDITQINLYKNLIKEKGTNQLAEGFKNAQFDQGAVDYNIYENWALNKGSFGHVLNSNYIEAELNEHLLTGNPTLLGFSSSGNINSVNQTVLLSELINWERPPATQSFLPRHEQNNEIDGLPTAGYVDSRDVKFQTFRYEQLNTDSTNINQLYAGDVIWIANHRGTWDVLMAQTLGVIVTQMINNQNGTVTISFSAAHNLVVNDLFAISSFSSTIDGFHTVQSTPTIDSVTISWTVFSSIITQTGNGVALRLNSVRYAQPSAVASVVSDILAPFSTELSWIDNDISNNWSVWGRSPVFKETVLPSIPQSTDLGTAVAYDSRIGVLVGDATNNIVYIEQNGVSLILTGDNGFGSNIVITTNGLYISSIDRVYYYEIISDGTMIFKQYIDGLGPISSIAVSSDGLWLYVAASDINKIVLLHYNSSTEQYNTTGSEITAPVVASGWGHSIATSTDGVKLIVGAPYQSFDELLEVGSVYVYTRGYRQYFADGITTVFSVAATISSSTVDVIIDGVLIDSDMYSIVGTNTVEFITAPTDGSIILISYDAMQLEQQLSPVTIQTGAMFGKSVDTNRFGSNIVVGAPFDISTVNQTAGVEGSVYQFVNSGQRYGQITLNYPQTSAGDIIYLDGYAVEFSDATSNTQIISSTINDATPTSIIASYTPNSVYITVKDNTTEVPGNIIDFVATTDVQTRISYVPYLQTQIINSPIPSNRAEFGSVVKMNERDELLISIPTADRLAPTIFDFKDDCLQNDTVFDNQTTTFIDSVLNTGTVAAYSYLPAHNETISNPGQYVFGQYIATSNTDSGYQPRFGTALAYREGVIVVGAPNWAENSGYATSFTVSTTATNSCTPVKPTPWYVDRVPSIVIDINKINNVSIYNRLTNQTIDYLDYTDPVRGKLLGAIASNLDYISTVDPAGYATDSQQWGPAQLGKTWMNTTNLRLYNYDQPDVTYNSTHWGRAFPGSSADVYTWIESTVVPLEYTGNGIPLSYDTFVTRLEFNESTNSIINVYYFWVKNLDLVPEGKTLSPLSVAGYILNPINSGIAFLAPMTTIHNGTPADVVAIYNSSEFVNDYSSALHIGYGNNVYEDTKHTVWQLIGAKKADSFLNGFPVIAGQQPQGLYLKYLDSFCGVDISYQNVPDPRLPELIKYGVNFNPRQTMFLDRRIALKNYVQYANSILSSQPVVETRNINFLLTNNIINNYSPLGTCRTATTLNLAATYLNGVDGVGATLTGVGSLPVIGSVTLNIGDRVLIKDQLNKAENGIYNVTKNTANWEITRSVDFDSDIKYGLTTVITEGDYASTQWTQITDGTIIIGGTNIVFDQLNSGPTYDTREFWTYADWWATGYDSSTKPVIEVDNYLELQTIVENTIITSSTGLILALENGLIARVKANDFDLSEIYIYERATGWTRIGVLNGTIQISDQIWQNTYGWDTAVWDYSSWNRDPYTETRYIIRWLNEVLYTSDLLIERNNSLMLMFRYIQSENIERNNYNPWLTKTSLIDVNHRIRSLLQYKKFQRDNQEFLSGYINEVKPYHVFIKDFIYSYNGLDVYPGNITDFDLPASFNKFTGKFDSPQLIYQPPAEDNEYLANNSIWATSDYNQWFNNYGLTYSTNTRQITEVTRLAEAITSTATVARIQNIYGLQESGVIYVGIEQIRYDQFNRDTLTISGLVRGYNDTIPTNHEQNSPVGVSAQAAIMLDVGRGYSAVPNTNVSIDVSYYPVPRSNAELTAIISNQSVTALTVSNVGAGYAIDPTVTIEGSTLSERFSGIDIDAANNQITVANNVFSTGDSVVYTTGNTSIDYGLIQDAYYYVRVIDSDTIALYKTHNSAKITWLGATTLDGDIDDISTTIIVTDSNILPNSFNIIMIDEERISYTGIDYETSTLIGVVRGVDDTIRSSHDNNSQIKVDSVKYIDVDFDRVSLKNSTSEEIATLTVTARAQTFTESYPVRMITTTIKFDRTTYVSDKAYAWDITSWDSGSWDNSNGDNAANRIDIMYEPEVNMPGRSLPQLMSGLEYPNATLEGINFSAGSGWDLFGWDRDGTLGWSSAANTSSLLDTVLIGPSFTDTVPKIYTMSGGEYPDGYGPEELVCGIISDMLNITVISNDNVLSFRQIVDRFGNKTVLNSNPYTQVFLTSNLSEDDDVIYVNDVSTLIDTRFNNVGNVIYINGEYIRFKDVDTTTNTLSSLQRGIMGSSVNKFIAGGTISASNITPGLMYSIVTVGTTDFTAAGAGNNTAGTVFYANSNSVDLIGTGTVIPVIQSVLQKNSMFQPYVDNIWWYGPPAEPSANTTLATNTFAAAEFLQQTS